jgi:hypothetical protein
VGARSLCFVFPVTYVNACLCKVFSMGLRSGQMRRYPRDEVTNEWVYYLKQNGVGFAVLSCRGFDCPKDDTGLEFSHNDFDETTTAYGTFNERGRLAVSTRHALSSPLRLKDDY